MRIAEAKVPDATRITDIAEDVFEGPCQDVTSHSTFTSKEIHSDFNPSDLSKRWQMGLGTSTKTLKATTQTILRSSIMPISRRYRTNYMFERTLIKGTIFTDTMEERYKSFDVNRYSQVFSNASFFADAYYMEKKSI